jgi:DNA-binding response OmpR family regulator
VQLPRKNGFELVREMKSRGRQTPVMLMSAVYTDQDQSTRTVQLGALADGYLTKPFDLVHLLAQVRQLLGEA